MIRRLESITHLSEQENGPLLHFCLGRFQRWLPIKIVVRKGDQPSERCLILSGGAFRCKMTLTSNRQIISRHIVGEIPDLQSLHLRIMSHNLAAFAPVRSPYVAHRTLHVLFEQPPSPFRCVLARDPDRRCNLSRVGGPGRKASSSGPIAHLPCELFLRHMAVEPRWTMRSSSRSPRTSPPMLWRPLLDRGGRYSGSAGGDPKRRHPIISAPV